MFKNLNCSWHLSQQYGFSPVCVLYDFLNHLLVWRSCHIFHTGMVSLLYLCVLLWRIKFWEWENDLSHCLHLFVWLLPSMCSHVELKMHFLFEWTCTLVTRVISHGRMCSLVLWQVASCSEFLSTSKTWVRFLTRVDVFISLCSVTNKRFILTVCRFNSPFVLQVNKQRLQDICFSSECLNSLCCFKLHICVQEYWHDSQVNGFSPVCVLLCLSNS